MAYPLKTNVSSKTNANLKSLNDAVLDDNFAKNLETLINGWTLESANKITLSNTSDSNKYAVQFTATAGTESGDYKLMDYVNIKINPTISNGQLNVDSSSKKITYTQKTATKETDKTTTQTTTTTPSQSSTKTPSTIDTLAQQLKQSGVFDNPLAKDVAFQGYNSLSEEILRVKKLMKL